MFSKYLIKGITTTFLTLVSISGHAAHRPTAIQQGQQTINEDFELSKSEKDEIQRFLTSMKDGFNLNYVIDEADQGNSIAMYIAGQCALGGFGGTVINRDVAHFQFKRAASLGYAPALFEVFQIYAFEKRDPLLAFVYLNLAISLGHNEYRDFYYQQTQKISIDFGKLIVQEIERLALAKAIKISELKTKLEKSIGTWGPALNFIDRLITSEDVMYTDAYWKPFFKSEKAWNDFFIGAPVANKK